MEAALKGLIKKSQTMQANTRHLGFASKTNVLPSNSGRASHSLYLVNYPDTDPGTEMISILQICLCSFRPDNYDFVCA